MISAKHKEFIRLESLGEMNVNAYVTLCNKKITSGAARVMLSRLRKRYAKEILEAKEQLSTIQDDANKSTQAKNALKTVLDNIKDLRNKSERLMEIQNEYDDISKKIKGEIEFTFCVGNKIMNSHTRGVFMLPVQIQIDLENLKDSKRKEISKLQGEYAATKTDITSNGESIITGMNIIDSKNNGG